MRKESGKNRVILIVMDSVGAGALPDAKKYGDAGAHTINHIYQKYPELKLPNLSKMGLSSIFGVDIAPFHGRVEGCFGRMAELSEGKDTITGHWEICGLKMDEPFRTFTDTGFPQEFISEFENRIGRSVIGNYSASGTEIIRILGEEHRRTGSPIVYTSADSVFQVAANVEVIPIETLYEYCEAARELLVGEWLVGRVIARPFIEQNGADVYKRQATRS